MINLSAVPIIERIGWMLIHSIWLLAIPAVLFGFLLWLTPESYSRLRYAAGIAALALMAVLPIASAPWIDVTAKLVLETEDGGNLDVQESFDRDRVALLKVESIERFEPNMAINDELRGTSDAPGRPLPAPTAAAARDAVALQPNTLERVGNSRGQTNLVSSEVIGKSSSSAQLGKLLQPFLPWAVAGWMIGVLLMSLRLLMGWRSTWRLKRQGVEPVPDTVESLFVEMKQRIGGCKAARLVQSTLVSVPSIVGHFRPVVLLPVSAMTGLSEEQLRAILAHELAHVKRHDYLLNIYQTVIETLLFYHPAVWWVSRCVREERENCCDDVALRYGCRASELAKALVTVDAIRPSRDKDSIDSTLIPAADGGDLLRRVRRLAGGAADKNVVGRSWIAGGIALGLSISTLLASVGNIQSNAQESSLQTSKAEETRETEPAEADAQRTDSDEGRLNFANGYYVELAAVADLPRPESDTASATAWRVSGSTIEKPPFYGTQVRPGLIIGENRVARKFYVRARMPNDATLNLDVGGMQVSGATTQPVADSTDVEIEADTIAMLPEDQGTGDLTVNLELPAWRTLASFDFAGGVKNGIIMDWEQKVSEFSRYTATGDFGPDATKENIRIIGFDQQHRQLEPTETSSEANEEGLTKLNVAFKISDGRPWHIVVQRRIATRPIVFRNVPLSPGKSEGVQIEIAGVVDEPMSPGTQDSTSTSLKNLLKEPFESLTAELPGAGTMRLISIREAGSESPGWHADGSPRLVPFRDEELWLMRPSTDDRHRKLEAMFEFVASSRDVRIGKIQIRPEDGSGSTSVKPIKGEGVDIPRVRLLQGLNILDDRETEDFEVDVFAGPVTTLTTLPVGDSPDGYAGKSWLGYTPDSGTHNLAFLISEPKETKSGVRHVVLSILPDEAPQGSVLTGITSDGQRVDGFTSSTSGRKILGTFTVPEGQTLKSIEIATQPRHSIVFRNVSVWPGLGSSAFVDNRSEPTAIDFDSVTPSRVFLLPSGERIAEQDGVGLGVSPALQALDEIERRGGLFRFDAEADAPTGDTLPYLTEIRWRDFRADELRWIQALAGLTRLELSSEFTTDESLRSIEHLATLTELELSRSRHLTTECLKSIGKLTELRDLELYGRSLQWKDNEYRADDFEHLRSLTKIVQWEPSDWRIDDAGITWLDNANDLTMVYGWGPAVTDKGFAALADKPNLGVINLGITKITDTSYKLLENHPKLYWLQCTSPSLTDAAIDSVITMGNLREVHLYQSQVTDTGVEKLIDAIDQLPRLETVNLSGTAVTQEAAARLRAARDGLRVLVSPPVEDAKVDDVSTSSDQVDDSSVIAKQEDSTSSEDDSTAASAPQNVPWPDKEWTQSLPPSGSGIRVKLDDRRWVEFNSVYATRKVDDQRTQVHWTADGELIEPPADFDPRSLVPDRDGGEMPSVTRGFLMQVVGPEGIRFSLDTSGSGGYGKMDYAIDDSFVQIPVDTIASSIGYNHAYAEVKISQEAKEQFSLDDSRFQVLIDADDKKVFVATANARDFAWRLTLERGDKAVEVEPFLVGGKAESNSFLPEMLKKKLKEGYREAQLLGFAFDKDQPMPKLESLERNSYDTVRFDNLSVYPGPRTAVVVSVNGVPIDEANRPEITPIEDAELNNLNPEARSDDDFDTVTLTGSVVDENGFGIRDCWVGLFIEPQEHSGQLTRSPAWAKRPLPAFAEGPPLAAEAKTDALGRFSFEAPKTHFVFEGQFWAMRPDGTLGTKWLNAVWSHVQKPENLKLTVRDDEATVRVIDPEGKPIAGADVTLEAIRMPRSVTHRLPEVVQRRLQSQTDDSGEATFGGVETAGVRGVAVSADGYGTQFLSDRLASVWVRGDQPLMLQLQPTASLSGRIVDFDPQLDQDLKLLARTEQHDGRPPLYGRAIAEVQDDGTFQMDRLAPGHVILESSLPPDSRRKIRFEYIAPLQRGDERRLTAERNPQMVPAVLVRQRLIKRDTGDAIPDCRLSVLSGDTGNGARFRQSQPLTTNADGWWMARVLPGAIDVRLVTVPDGYRSTAWFDGRYGRGGVTAMVPATDKLVTLPPEPYVPAVEVTGSLQYADGSPAADWSVNGHPISWDDMGVGAVRTERDGSFTLTYPNGYPPRLFHASNRQWMTEHDFTDSYIIPEVISNDPLVLKIPEAKAQEPK